MAVGCFGLFVSFVQNCPNYPSMQLFLVPYSFCVCHCLSCVQVRRCSIAAKGSGSPSQSEKDSGSCCCQDAWNSLLLHPGSETGFSSLVLQATSGSFQSVTYTDSLLCIVLFFFSSSSFFSPCLSQAELVSVVAAKSWLI